ncbi:MAG: hypothetical protein M0Z75_04335 [Nitrospiraceae bacterium]|nr:hypothetical protein [Nitrospiraceae bacterium]
MSFVNLSLRQISCRIVYCGPALSGKTTNLRYISRKTSPARGRFFSLSMETERTLFFDFLSLPLGEIKGFKVRFHLYTVPGQVFYAGARKLILKGADGVVFVADSRLERIDANLESIGDLRRSLGEMGFDPERLPFVIQYNKRDMTNVVPSARMDEALNPAGAPAFEAVAARGDGVMETLKAASKLVLRQLK